MYARDHDVTTADGRVLRVVEMGAEGGDPVLVHHGTPGGRMLFKPHAEVAAGRGARLIGYDRPGYGGSHPDPGRNVAAAAADAAAIADALGYDRFVTYGGSGGGPHSLACAALLDGRAAAAATLAGVAPYGAEGLDFLAGMGEDNVVEFSKAIAGRVEIEPFLRELTPEILAGTPEEFAELLASLLSPPDLEVFTGEVAEYILGSMKDGLARSPEGWVEDDLAFAADWGFSVEDIRVPVLLLQGEQDLMVPGDHARWLAGHIPGVDARITPEDGHLTLLERRLPDVLDWLLAKL